MLCVQGGGQVLHVWMCSSPYSPSVQRATSSSAAKEKQVYTRDDTLVCACVYGPHLQENYEYLKEKLSEVCGRHGERVLATPHNPISLGRLLVHIYTTES